LWPVVAATALLVGAVGGVLAGVAVSTTMSSGSVPIVLGTGHSVAAPLDPNNRSVAAVAQKLLPSTVQVLAKGGADGNQRGGATGSGFVIDRDGHVITNNHVVSNALGAGQVQVVDYAGHSHAARIVGRSPVYDIAVLEVDGGNHLAPAALGSSRSMHVGETVVAIGSPLGLSSTVTSGIVSALDRPVTTSEGSHASYINAVQTDAAINPGNSGGPLVNLRGEVIGVNSAIATTGPTFGGQAGNIGVGFAIPMEQVELTAAEILRTGHAKYPVIGATVQVNGSGNGAKVVGVPPGSPADQAGLRKGDVVVAVDGPPVEDGNGLIVAIRAHQPGDTVTRTVRRGGEPVQVRIRLAAKVG
jgi:putative serine protease PepD